MVLCHVHVFVWGGWQKFDFAHLTSQWSAQWVESAGCIFETYPYALNEVAFFDFKTQITKKTRKFQSLPWRILEKCVPPFLGMDVFFFNVTPSRGESWPPSKVTLNHLVFDVQRSPSTWLSYQQKSTATCRSWRLADIAPCQGDSEELGKPLGCSRVQVLIQMMGV